MTANGGCPWAGPAAFCRAGRHDGRPFPAAIVLRKQRTRARRSSAADHERHRQPRGDVATKNPGEKSVRQVNAAVAPTDAVTSLRRRIGKSRARHPSRSPMIAETKSAGKQHRSTTKSPGRSPLDAATQIARHDDRCRTSSRNTSARFIEVMPYQSQSSICMDHHRGSKRTADAEAPAARLRQPASQVTRPWKLPSAGVRPWRPRCGSPSCRSRACRAPSWSG